MLNVTFLAPSSPPPRMREETLSFKEELFNWSYRSKHDTSLTKRFDLNMTVDVGAEYFCRIILLIQLSSFQSCVLPSLWICEYLTKLKLQIMCTTRLVAKLIVLRNFQLPIPIPSREIFNAYTIVQCSPSKRWRWTPITADFVISFHYLISDLKERWVDQHPKKKPPCNASITMCTQAWR